MAGSRDGCWSVSESEPISGQLAQEVGGVAFPVGGVSGPGRLAKSGTFQASVSGQPPTAASGEFGNVPIGMDFFRRVHQTRA